MNIEQKSNTQQFRKALEGLLKREVLVGIPAANAGRDPETPANVLTATKEELAGLFKIDLDKRSRMRASTPGASGATNALLGYVHEYGSPAQNIPARPFLRPGIIDGRQKIELHMKTAAQLALRGKTDEVNQELEKVGLEAQKAVQLKITTGPFEPLKPATLAARRRRGRTGTSPLIDTTQLRRSITYVVR